MKKIQFQAALAPLVAYCKDELTPEQTQIYFMALEDLDPQTLMEAVSVHILESRERWWPSIGQLRAAAAEVQNGRRLSWAEAWGIVTTTAVEFSPHDPGKSRRAIAKCPDEIAKIVREQLGGWAALADSDTRTFSVKQSLFRDLWNRREVEQKRLANAPAQKRFTSAMIGELAQSMAIPQNPNRQRQINHDPDGGKKTPND